MRALLPIFVLLALVACNNQADDSIDSVPEPSAETANRLMGEAERAADNAQARLGDQTTITNQGAAR